MLHSFEIPNDLGKPDVVGGLFAPEAVDYAVRRMSSKRDKDDLVTNPVGRLILIEFKDHLVPMISRLVTSGLWTPSSAYLCLTNKRSGNHRELVFPCLIDSIVGRHVIDALESLITTDDNNQTFCGRSHASSHRVPGDYDNWFQTWLDFSSAIAVAAKMDGFAYVYDTDVADFFPSIDRIKAKQFLAQRTGAHASLLELLFCCLESWLPRFDYMAMPGIPIEPNDVSRLVAHNYLKTVDHEFTHNLQVRYLRYVDDTTIFVATNEDAVQAKRRHHLALRRVGLNPNAAKSEILTVGEYEKRRHREFNLEISRAAGRGDADMFKRLVTKWYGSPRRNNVENWDRVARYLYRVALKSGFDSMRRRVLKDIEAYPELTGNAFTYLRQFHRLDSYLDGAFRLWDRANVEQTINIARFLCDGSFSLRACDRIAGFAVRKIKRIDERPGSGYAKGLLLLALNKHGARRHHDQILAWASPDTLIDEQLRLHFLYIFGCRRELPTELRTTLVQLASSDIDLVLRLSDRAVAGAVTKLRKILKLVVRKVGDSLTIEGRYLPLVTAICASRQDSAEVIKRLDGLLQPKRAKLAKVDDAVLRRTLLSLREGLSA